jgi:hypothetical protein
MPMLQPPDEFPSRGEVAFDRRRRAPSWAAHLRVRGLSGVTPGTVIYVEQYIASPRVHPSEALPGTRDRSSRRATPRSLPLCMPQLSVTHWPTS